MSLPNFIAPRSGLWLALFLSAATLCLLAVHFTHDVNPLNVRDGNGWNGWWDQGQYWRSAKALVAGDLSSSAHWYPVGYALFAAPFVPLLPDDPFVFVNAIAFAIYGWAFFRLFQPIIGALFAILAFAIALSFPITIDDPFRIVLFFWKQFAVPWNTVPVAACYVFILAQLVARNGMTGRLGDFAIGIAAATVVVMRPIDVLPLIPAGLVFLFQRLNGPAPLARIGVATGGILVVLVPVLALTLAIHGGFASPYVATSENIGFGFSQLPLRAYSILLDSQTVWEEKTALLALQSWLAIALPFFLFWTVANPRQSLLVAATCALSLIQYLAYNDFSPQNAVRFQSYHYLVWMLPVLTAGGFAGAVNAFRFARLKATPVRAAAAAVLFFLSITIFTSARIEPMTLPTQDIQTDRSADGAVNYKLVFKRASDIDIIDIRGGEAVDRIGITLENLGVEIDGSQARRFKDYRTIATSAGIRIIFQRKVPAETVAFTLGDFVSSAPVESETVVPSTLSWTFDPLWRIHDR